MNLFALLSLLSLVSISDATNYIIQLNQSVQTENRFDNMLETLFENFSETSKEFVIGDMRGVFIYDSDKTIEELETQLETQLAETQLAETIPGTSHLDIIESIDADSDVKIQIIETEATGRNWGIDRIDQLSLPLDNTYTPTYTGANVDVYVLDTGILKTHNEFSDVNILPGIDIYNDDVEPVDDNGHGTHVSSTICGKSLGVSRNVNIIPVKVIGKYGSGSWTHVLEGFDWVLKQVARTKRCSIVSMSLGGDRFEPVDNAINELYKKKILTIAAAGNSNANTCNISPGGAARAVAVGSTNITDHRSSFSNIGPCVDIFAPGSSILGASIISNTSTVQYSGTSMATPHVTGVVAMLIEKYGCGDIDNIVSKLSEISAKDAISLIPGDTTNKFLQIPDGTINCRRLCSVVKRKTRCNNHSKCDCKWRRSKCVKE